MNRIVRTLAALSTAALILAGCSTATTACKAQAGPPVTICINGKAVDFSAEKTGPHKHEIGNLYAPAIPLAQALGLEIETDAKTKTVVVAGKKVELTPTKTVMGIHVHDGALFVPVKEFAAAAGLRLDLNYEKGIAGLAR